MTSNYKKIKQSWEA